VAIFIGLGSNLGDKRKNIEKAIQYLRQYPDFNLVKQSTIIETKAYGKTDQPDFLNCVVEVKTKLTPHDLLNRCHIIEKMLGRIRSEKWGPREIDLDILFYNNEIIKTANLIIPHPEVHKREFVLQSLKEIAPNFVHPILKTRMQDLYRLAKSKKEEENTVEEL